MSDATPSAAPPKKRSLFKRPAWQDTPKDDDADIFSHSNEFSDIVADDARRRAEEKRRQDEKKRQQACHARKHSAPRETKRRRTSGHSEDVVAPSGGSDNEADGSRDNKVASAGTVTGRARSKTPLSSTGSLPHKDSLVIELGDSEDDAQRRASHAQQMPVRPSRQSPVVILDEDDDDDDDDDDKAEDEDNNSMFAVLKARARARLAAKAKAAALSAQGADAPKAPIIQLLITSCIPNTNALVVKIRVDSLIEKPRKAWCAKQGFSQKEADAVFFTWKGTRIYDSTSVIRLGIKVDDHGNAVMEGDTNIYDDVNLPKVHVEAWTDELYKERKKEEAAAAAAKKLATEAPAVVEQRTPTPEPAPASAKLRLILRAKGKADLGLTVNPHTTITHIASAYKTQLNIDKSQPITLMFDGERLMPLDTVADYEMEDRDGLEVLFK